jgi:uncharacterized lipoprotein YajG
VTAFTAAPILILIRLGKSLGTKSLLEVINSQTMKKLIILTQLFSILATIFLSSCAEEPVTATTTTTRETTVTQPAATTTTTTRSTGY